MTTAPEIFKLARKKLAANKDRNFERTISTLLDQLNDDLNTGNSLALILLSYLLKNPVVIETGTVKIKPSKDELLQFFIAHVPNPPDAETYRLNRNVKVDSAIFHVKQESGLMLIQIKYLL